MNTVRLLIAALALVSLAACTPTHAGTTAGSAGPTVTVPTPPKTGPQTTFTDGTWVVGEDIVAGTYKSTGAEEGLFELCAVSTYPTDTADGRVIAFDTANANEPIRLNLSGKVKSVKAAGCAPFVKVR